MLRFSGLCVVCSFAIVLGCSQGAVTNPTVPVTGKVTLDSAPVEGATVAFVPDDQAGKARVAVGTTDKDGKYTLLTAGGGKGAIPGRYKVTITKVDAPAGEKEPPPKSQEEAMERYRQKMKAGGPKAFLTTKTSSTAKKTSLPEMYASTEKSGLMADVQQSGDNTNNYDLQSSGGAKK